MAEKDVIVIDTDKANDIAYLVETRDRVLLQHGGSVTQMQFSEVRQMSLDWWVEHEAPKLKRLDRQMLVLRDTMAGAFTLMTGDQVLQYKLDNVSEVPLDELMNMMDREKIDECITPNLPWPLVAKIVRGGKKSITVELASQKRHVRIPMMEVDDDIWYPPVWFRVDMSTANVLNQGYVSVVVERNLEWEDTRLYKLALPNVSGDGRICFGNAVATAHVDQRTPNEAESLQAILTLFFDSEFNNHLLFSTGNYDNMVSIGWQHATKREHFMQKKGFANYPGLMKYLAVLADEGGWRSVKFEQLSQSYAYGVNVSNATRLTAKQFVGL